MQLAEDTRHQMSTARRVLLIAGIVVIAANLRGPLTVVGPLLETIRTDTHMSAGQAGMLPALPLLTFAIVSPWVSRLARRAGMERLLWLALLVLTAGILLRSVPVTALLWGGTVLLGIAIAVGNVLLPSLIKRDFPDRIGFLTSIYSTVMGSVGAIVSGVAVPVATVLPGGWRAAFGCLAGLALIGLAIWLPQLGGRTTPSAPTGTATGTPWGSRLAWQVTAYMGLQSFGFYIVLSWLPAILQSHGASAEKAGWLLFVLQVLGVAMSAVIPLVAQRLPDQRALAAGGSLLSLTGYLGMLVAPDAALIWVVVIGLASGTCFVLALSFLTMRAADSQQSAALSGMAQAVGYLLATLGPVLFGALHDASGGWTLPLCVLSVAALTQSIAGLGAGRTAHV